MSQQAENGSADKNQILARMNRLTIWSLPFSFLLIIGMGYFFTFYDIADIGFAMPAIATQFNLTGNESLFVALSVGLIGYIVGSYLVGTLSDRSGRYKAMLATMIITAIGSFGDAASTGLVTLSIWRFVTGVGVGADLNLVSTYISELAPYNQRGRISVLTFLIGIIGQAVTPFVALALVPNFDYGWRLLFLIGGVIAVIAATARFALPESPRWLVLQGRNDEANAVVTDMENTAARRLGHPLPAPSTEVLAQEEDTRGFPTKHLFKRPYSTRLALLVFMWFFWYIGNYGFLGDAATLLSSQNITIGNSILFLAVGAAGYPIGAAIMMAVADKLERRVLILISTVIWLDGMLMLGSLASNTIIASGAFLASISLGMYLQVAYTFTAESFPTRARTSGFALSDGLGHLGGALGALILPVLVASYSFGFGFGFIGITGLIAGLIALMGPSVTQKSLEGISN